MVSSGAFLLWLNTVVLVLEPKCMQDDPVCVAAREGGKKVVSELWVDDSLDARVIADADRVNSATVLTLPELRCVF